VHPASKKKKGKEQQRGLWDQWWTREKGKGEGKKGGHHFSGQGVQSWTCTWTCTQ
jgi:hypothetical protein